MNIMKQLISKEITDNNGQITLAYTHDNTNKTEIIAKCGDLIIESLFINDESI